jgi:hypothetical protein
MIGPQVLVAINELCGKLGYMQIDGTWGTADKPADLRVPVVVEDGSGEGEPAEGESAEDRAPVSADVAEVPVAPVRARDVAFADFLGERPETGLARVSDDFGRRWNPCAEDTFLVVAEPGGSGPDARWLVDLKARAITPAHDLHGDDEPDTGWDIIAPASVWEDLIAGRRNMSVELRRHSLRYCEGDPASPVIADTRVGMLADFLGLTSWGRAVQDRRARQANGAAKLASAGAAAREGAGE